MQGLDDAGVALLLSLTFSPLRQHRQEWVESAERLWGDGFSEAQIDAAIAELVARGHATPPGEDSTRFSFRVDTEIVFGILRLVHARDRLDPALRRLDAPRRSVPSAWERPERELGLARAMMVMGGADVALPRVERFADRLRPGRYDRTPAFELRLFGFEPEAQWLDSASDATLVRYAKVLGEVCVQRLEPLTPVVFDRVVRCLEVRTLPPAKRNPPELLRAAMLWLPPDRTERLVARRGTALRRKLELLRSFAAGDLEAAHAVGVEILESRAPARGALKGLEAVVFVLAGLDAARRGVPGAWLHIEAVLTDARGEGAMTRPLDLLWELFLLETGQSRASEISHALEDAFYDIDPALDWVTVVLGHLIARWVDVALPEDAAGTLAALVPRVARLGTTLLPQTCAGLTGSGAADGTLLEAYAPRAPWEHMVEQLEAFADVVSPPIEPETAQPGFTPSIVWQVEDDADGMLVVSPRLIASPRSHGGRAIRIDEVVTTYGQVADARDEAIVAAYQGVHHRLSDGRSSVSFAEGNRELTFALAFALVGHSRVRDPSGAPVSVVQAHPRLVVEGGDRGARVSIEPAALTHVGSVAHTWEGAQRLVLYASDERLEPVFRAVASLRGAAVPHSAVSRLRPTLARLTDVLTVCGRGTVDLSAQELEAATGIDVDLQWRDPTLRIEVGVRPLGRHGPRCPAGQGQVDLVVDTGEGLRTTHRDLEAETTALERALHACPMLGALEVDDAGGRFVVGMQRACAVLEEVTRAAAAGHVRIGWPRGKALRLSREYDRADMEITIKRGRTQWLAVEAGLSIDEGVVVAWKLLAKGRGGANRFVALESGDIIRLSDALRRTLDALARLDGSDPDSADAEVPELMLVASEELFGDWVRLADDVAERKGAIAAAFQAEFDEPEGLAAELRGYQRDGYLWMMRLASAGLGGVLADDMGLGKTVQSLAMLLARASEGPSLVVCPTSVIVNWQQEAQRFAPALRFIDLGAVPAGDRLPVLEAVEPGEVAVMSYGVLQRLGDDAQGLRFSTVVFDEVHALKNATTSRATVAAGIEADVRFGLTGTPLENHIGELWAVMQACVPGLLGDRVLFGESIGKAVAEGIPWAQRHLRAVLEPFILRRRKETVLRELPPRTEAVVMVEPSEAERAWYEAQRQAAEARIREALEKELIKPGQASVRLLTEIGRLRQAAIEPRLVEEDAPRGAKLDRVVERCQQLVSAGHQVLVFTQFLGVLAILDERLRARGIATLELQGSTGSAERARRVEAFQAGEADVFLMSLRAGGIGVNLTAADYVLHVDPWWNPAVEAQATGRAHRMGQTRPVTVYRYCTEGSIERKILALHETKRDLAEDVLSDMGGRKTLDIDTLQALLARW